MLPIPSAAEQLFVQFSPTFTQPTFQRVLLLAIGSILTIGRRTVSRMLKVFYYQVMRMVHKWLNRRSQRNRWAWDRFLAYVQHYPLPLPHIVHKLY